MVYELKGKTDDGNAIVQNKDTQELKIVEMPKFKHNEVVKTSARHYSQKDYTRVLQPSYTDERGWIYGESFINIDTNTGGGMSFWNDEYMYEKFTDLEMKIKAKLFELKSEISVLKNEINAKQREVEKLEYALNVKDAQAHK